MDKIYNQNKELIIKLIIIFSILTFIFLIKYIFYLFSPFIIGYIISKILRPISNYYVRNFKINQGVSAIVSIITFFVIVFLIGTVLYSGIKHQLIDLSENIPMYTIEVIELYEKVKEFLYKVVLLPTFIKDTFSITFENIMKSVAGFLTDLGTSVAKSIITKIPTIFMNIVIGFVSSFFFLKDNKLISNSVKKYTPTMVSNVMKLLREKVGFALSAYVKAQSILMCITSIIVLIGLLILKSDYALTIALITGFIDAIPMFGSGFVLYPWIAYNFLIGNYMQAIGLGVIYCVAFLSRQIFEPKILGVQIGLHPLLTLISIYVGFKLFGIIGLILGPVAVITIKTVLVSDIKELER